MSPKQRIYLFRLFAAAAKKVGARADDELRREWTFQILGESVSWAVLKPAQIDKLIVCLQNLADGIPMDSQVCTEIEADERTRARLIHAIESYMPHAEWRPHGTGIFWPEYIDKISENCFGTANWKSLTNAQLQKLRITLDHRARAKHPRVT